MGLCNFYIYVYFPLPAFTPVAKLGIHDNSGTGINTNSITVTNSGAPVIFTIAYDASTAQPIIEIPNLPNGLMTLDISAADNTGNTATYPWTFIVNRTHPTFSNFSPAPNAYLYNPNPVISANYTSNGFWPIDPASLSITLIDAAGTTTTLSANQITATLTGFEATLDPYNLPAEGLLTVLLTVADIMGNVGDTAQHIIKVDITPPKLFELTPFNGTTIDVPDPIFTGSAIDRDSGIDVTSFKVYLNSEYIT